MACVMKDVKRDKRELYVFMKIFACNLFYYDFVNNFRDMKHLECEINQLKTSIHSKEQIIQEQSTRIQSLERHLKSSQPERLKSDPSTIMHASDTEGRLKAGTSNVIDTSNGDDKNFSEYIQDLKDNAKQREMALKKLTDENVRKC